MSQGRATSGVISRESTEAICPSWHVYALTAYYLVLFIGLFWFALDVWSGQFNSLRLMISGTRATSTATLTVVSYTLIGGAVGSMLYSIRIFFGFYTEPERKRYNRRWFMKYVTAPWEGAAMAMVVASFLRGGVAVFGQANPPEIQNTFAAFAVGTLVGFSVREAVQWLHNITLTMFGKLEKKDL